MNPRNFTRIDAARVGYPTWYLSRSTGQYLDVALLFSTPVWLAALASRLSHESCGKAEPERDNALLERLKSSGDEHAKSLRGRQFYLLIEAPRYFWAEMDTYTVGVISMGSTSTMHKEARGAKGEDLVLLKSALTEGTLQCRMKCFSDPALRRIISQRSKHRLPEWQEFCTFAERILREY